MVRPAWCIAIVLSVAGLSCAPAVADESRPLHERIDQLVEAVAIGPLAPRCSDADFIRRIYLDLTGVIPTADQARAFFADASPNKRQCLIDDLLASPEFVRHMTITFDVMLMERKTDKTVKQPEWEAFLFRSLADDKPLDQLYREMIAADGADEALRPAARFVLDRDAEPNLLTRDIGRLVFGMDLQCAQCHDHPLVDDYYQADYYGLFAFIHRTALFTDTKTKLVSLTEKADGEASFKSVFTGDGSDRALPRLPKGAVLYVEPTFAKGEEYTVKPDKTVRGVPKFSRRQALAEMLEGSRPFSRNLANRLWAVIFGRGIVHPLDFHHADNPPANPKLLAILADELKAGGFQLRPFLRELVLTRTYERSCDAPRPEIVNFGDVAARLQWLEKEREARTAELTPHRDALAKAKADFKAARTQDAQVAAELPKLEKSVADARQALAKATTERTSAEEVSAKARQQAEAVAELAEKTAGVVQNLSDDKVLAEAAGKISQRAGELTASSEEAAKTAVARASEHAAAVKNVANAEAELAKVVSARPTPQRLSELERVELTAAYSLSAANETVAAIEIQIATAKAIGEYAVLVKTDPAKADAAWTSLVDRWTIAGQLAPLKPLSPEQFALSAMQAAGSLAPQAAAAQAKLEKSPPDALKNAADTEKPRMLTRLLQTELLAQLRGTCSEFVKQYGGLPGQDFQATLNQALFFGNGGVVDGWLKPQGQNLVGRLTAADDKFTLADELYLSVLTRPPSESEKQSAAAFLRERESDKPVAIAEVVWALLSSSEFRFNH